MKILVLGIGNVMFGDEGFGVHFVKMMAQNFTFSPEVKFEDGGTLAGVLSGLIAGFDELVVVDCIEADGANVGDVFSFPFSAMPSRISWSGSAHEVEMLQTLQMMELLGDLPKTQIVAVVPKRVAPMTFTLSEELVLATQTVQKALLAHLKTLGVSAKKVADISLQEVADRWKEAQFKFEFV